MGKDEVMKMTRAWDNLKRIGVPGWNRTHDLPNTGGGGGGVVRLKTLLKIKQK